MKHASYTRAIEFIALNDDNGSADALDTRVVEGCTTIVLVSELFGVPRSTVAQDVVAVRKRAEHGNATGEAWRMPRLKGPRDGYRGGRS
jgi:hypothetical protein